MSKMSKIDATLRYLSKFFKKHLQNISQRTLKDILKLFYTSILSAYSTLYLEYLEINISLIIAKIAKW